MMSILRHKEPTIQRLEELSMNAWPALQTLFYDGWILRFANGYTRRANSIQPLYFSTQNIDEKIRTCEEFYRNRNLRAAFKMTASVYPQDLDEILDQKGYEVEGLTSVQVADRQSSRRPRGTPAGRDPQRDPAGSLAGRGATPSGVLESLNSDKPTNRNATLSETLTEEWLDIFCRLSAIAEQHKPTMRRMLESIVPKHCFSSWRGREQVIACGLAVAQGEFIGLFDLVADGQFRNRGFGKQLILNLLEWGKKNGARRAYLQVMLNNAPALHLYSKLGFREIYKYWYRIKPLC